MASRPQWIGGSFFLSVVLLMALLTACDTPWENTNERIVLQPNETIAQNGLKMTLKQVDITASEAIVTVHYSAISSEVFRGQLSPGAYAMLDVPSESNGVPEPARLVSEPDGVQFHGNTEGDFDFSFSVPTLPRRTPVDATVTVEAGSTRASRVNGHAPPRLGTWVFHFTVPASSSQK